KYDLLDKVVFKLSSDIMKKVLTLLEKERQDRARSIQEEVIAFIDALLHYLLENKELLPIVHKNLSQGLYTNELMGETNEIVTRF
ncbi:MAG: hypothetical protein RRY54_07490, partial [Angelakisella sp.]